MRQLTYPQWLTKVKQEVECHGYSPDYVQDLASQYKSELRRAYGAFEPVYAAVNYLLYQCL